MKQEWFFLFLYYNFTRWNIIYIERRKSWYGFSWRWILFLQHIIRQSQITFYVNDHWALHYRFRLSISLTVHFKELQGGRGVSENCQALLRKITLLKGSPRDISLAPFSFIHTYALKRSNIKITKVYQNNQSNKVWLTRPKNLEYLFLNQIIKNGTLVIVLVLFFLFFLRMNGISLISDFRLFFVTFSHYYKEVPRFHFIANFQNVLAKIKRERV